MKVLALVFLVSCSPIPFGEPTIFTKNEREFLRCVCTSYYFDLAFANKKEEIIEVACNRYDGVVEIFDLGYKEWIKPCNGSFQEN